MKSSAFYAVLGVGILIVIGIIWFGFHHQRSTTSSTLPYTATSSEATDTPALTGLSIYANGVEGFSVTFPASAIEHESFDMQYHLPPTWRVNALSNATGTPVVSFIGYKTTSDNSYPRYYEAEVRVGVSADPQELAVCEKPGNGETVLPDKQIQGVAWKAFSLESAGMMQYLKGVSYRTIHDHTCYALEQVAAGSSYRDDPASVKDISDATLTQHYNDLSAIVDSFTFARP